MGRRCGKFFFEHNYTVYEGKEWGATFWYISSIEEDEGSTCTNTHDLLFVKDYGQHEATLLSKPESFLGVLV